MARTSTAPTTSTAAETPESPRYASAWAALVFALCALSLSWPVLTGHFLGNVDSDQYLAGYSFREFSASYLKSHGAFAQWNPYLFGGMPYVASMNGDMFYPTFLLRLLMPVGTAMALGMILHFFLAGMGAYWFLRGAARVSYRAAVVGGVAYMMGGQVSSLVSAGHDGKLFVSALFPITLLVATWGMRDGKKWAWGLLALIVGLDVLTPHPQLLQYLLLCTGAWSLFLAFGGIGEEKLPTRVAVQRLAFALAAVIVGGAIGAIQYWPVREYVPWSPRAGGRDYEFATSFSLPLEEILNFYLPEFSGILQKYWGRNSIHYHSEYVGASVFVLAAAAFGGWAGAKKRFLWFWTGTAIVTLLWGLGGSTPFFRIIYELVPGTKFVRAPMTILYINSFAIAVLAALGTEKLLSARKGPRYAWGWIIGAVAVALFAMVGGFTGLAQNLAVAPQLADRAAENADAVRLGALRSLIFVAMACGALILCARQLLTVRWTGVALVAIVAADLFSVERLYWDFSRPAPELFASDPTIDFLKKLDQPARVITWGLAEQPAARRDPYLAADGLMVHRIRQSLIGYHGNQLGRYNLFAGEPQGYDQVANPTFWALSNSQYLLSNTDQFPLKDLSVVVGKVKNAAGTMVTLYKLPGENPLAWVAPAMMKFPDASVLEAVRAPNFPVRSVALFDTSSKVEAVQLSALPAPLDIKTRVTAYDAGHIALTLSAPAPKGSALVVSENYYPGWRVKIDGKPGNVERADLVLMGVPLPEGAREVELTFTSDSYETGKRVTLAAILLSLLAIIGGVVAERRRGASVARAGATA